MAKLEQRGLSLEIKNIKALYCEGDDINLDEDCTYEAFDIFFKINNEDIPHINGTYELCEGNISGLLDCIDNCLNYYHDTSIEFTEPNFSFEIKKVSDDYYKFIVWCHDESFSNGAYGDTCVGFKFILEWQDLANFYEQLRYEFNHKKRLLYKDYKEDQRKFYENM